MYRDRTDGELLDLVKKHGTLTFGARIKLQQELLKRGKANSVAKLNAYIDNELSEIRDMKYLTQLGFQLEHIENDLRITRTQKAIFSDILAVFSGILLTVMGFFGLFSFIGALYADENINLLGLTFNIGQMSLGVLGVKFLTGFKRFFDFLGFELYKTNDQIRLKKRFDIKLNEVEKNIAKLHLEEPQGMLILKLENDEIFGVSSENIIQRMTMRELVKKLKNE